jgi:gas vesicle protein
MMSFMTGAVMGGLVGATLGLLLTPYSGNDLQAEVRARIERVQQEMKSAAQSRREELEAQLEALRAPLPPSNDTDVM